MTFNVKFFNRTLAHELGHGAFTWQHPFDEPFKNEQGATRNLMDYVTDDDLAYFQWQSTLGLNLTWGFLEGDEDGMKTDPIFYFTIDSSDYKFTDTNSEGKNVGAIYTTMNIDKELEIEFKRIDNDTVDVQSLICLFGNEKIPLSENKVKIKLDKYACINEKLTKDDIRYLKIYEKLNDNGTEKTGKELASLKIVPYMPTIYFDYYNGYQDEYLFDDAFNLKEKYFVNRPSFLSDYLTYINANTNKADYAPVLGLQKGLTAKLKIVYDKESSKYLSLDRKFKLFIKFDTTVADVSFPEKNYNEINITSKKYTLSSPISIMMPNEKDTIGKIELICKEVKEIECNLIYVKFKDETEFPRLDMNNLQTYLNTKVFNKLFLKLKFDSIHFESSLDTAKIPKNTNNIYNRLFKDFQKKQPTSDFTSSKSPVTKDYYFITDLEIKKEGGSDQNLYVGGGHIRGKQGGLQMKFNGSIDGETEEEVTAHEYGHMLGLSHCFKEENEDNSKKLNGEARSNSYNRKLQHRGNFMDYHLRRYSWFKWQLLEVIKKYFK